MEELAGIVASAVVTALKDNGLVGQGAVQTKKSDKSAYAKTEMLLYNYNNFKKIVQDKLQEIEDLRKYGVPQKSAMSGGERVQSSRTNVGIVLPEDAVEDAVRTVERSVAEVNRAIRSIENALDKIKYEQYHKIIPLFYFDGCTLEDIGLQLNCDHSTISRNKSKLVRSMALWLFPNDVVTEYMN
jgi:hypothetical protein